MLIDPYSFYEWRQPRQTTYTLSLFVIASVAFCLTPSWLLVKVITLIAGLVFFALFPIGSRYPDYRLLASPAKWLFWNIPDHGEHSSFKWRTVSDSRAFIVAEWAIARLQIEGTRQETFGVHQEKHVDLESKGAPQHRGGLSVPSLPTSKHSAVQHRSPRAVDGANPGADPTARSPRVLLHVSYKCTSGRHSGSLFVTSLGVRFETAVGFRHQWEITYGNMKRVEKVRNSDPKFHPLLDVLSLTAEIPLNRSIALSRWAPVKISCSLMGMISRLRRRM